MKLALSIDIGGTSTKIAFISPAGQMEAHATCPTQGHRDGHAYLESLFEKIDVLIGQCPPDITIVGTGIGAPGANELSGTIDSATNLPFLDQHHLIDIFSRQYQAPAYLVKDSTAATLGEQVYGAGRNCQNFMLITMGTGLGSGVVANGMLIRGAGGLAGELGHTVIRHRGRYCKCGKRGCLETYVSATGLKRTVLHLFGKTGLGSTLGAIPSEALNARLIAEAALKGDPLARLAFRKTGKVLGQCLADQVAFLQPKRFILAGGLSDAGELLLAPVRQHLKKNLLAMHKEMPEVITSSLGANQAALLGAASLVFKPAHSTINL